MDRGVKKLFVAASFAAAGCAAAPNAVEVRPIAAPGAKLRPGLDRLADAKGQLAIGNIGLALEGFRTAARQYPDNPEAFAGLAACYEAMRRYDLAQSNYEAALALAPKNTVLLAKLADALDQQGKGSSAAEVRGEIAQINSASAALDQAQAEPEPLPAEATLAPSRTVSVALVQPTVKAPGAPYAAPQAAPRVVARPMAQVPAPDLRSTNPIGVLTDSASVLTPRALGELATLVAPAEPAPLKVPAPQLGRRETVKLASGSLIASKPVILGRLDTIAAPLSTPVPAMVAAPRGNGPRLERLSLGEVALLTAGEPVWRGQVVASTPQKVTVRWVPVTTAAARPNIRLLNAARSQGLAARTRDYLFDRGWRKIEIGDADSVRDRSVVLYPAMRPAIGRSLAAQFGIKAQPTTTSEVFVVFLGRDAAALRTAPTRG